jgi:bifunctional non-homologous end joining protein LigD
VIVWDRGSWYPEGDPAAGYRAGKLKFRLDGEKLHGTWMLVRMHGRERERQEPWLLIKERDEAARPAADYSVVDALPNSVLSQRAVVEAPKAKARATEPSKRSTAAAATRASRASAAAATDDAEPSPAVRRAPAKSADAGPASKKPRSSRAIAKKAPDPASALPAGAVKAALPDTLAPELATLVADVPADGDWSYEIKFDGYRVLARIGRGEVRLLTRNGNDWTAKLKGNRRRDRPTRHRLGVARRRDRRARRARRLRLRGAAESPSMPAARRSATSSSTCRTTAGHDLRQVALGERRALLGRLLAEADGIVRFSQDFESDAERASCATPAGCTSRA